MSQIDSGIRGLFALPAVYDFFQNLVGVSGVRRRWIRDVLKPFPGIRILDIGCGTAELLRFLPEDIRYTGYDMSAEYIAAARKRFGDRGRFLCEPVRNAGEDARPLPEEIGEGLFDLVLASGVLHHLDDGEARQVFRSARRALKPGGRIVTLDPAFVDRQNPLARWVVAHDRGRNVRSPEGYADLGRESFAKVEASAWRGALRIPFDHALLVAYS